MSHTNFNRFADNDREAFRRFEGLPEERTVRGSHAFTRLLDGLNLLLFFWGGKDRTRVLCRVTKLIQATDELLSIAGSFVERTEDYAGIFLLIHRRHRDSRQNLEVLRRLADKIDAAFAAE